MKRIAADDQREVLEFSSHGAHWTPITHSDGECHVGRMRFEAGAVLGMHPADVDQVFFVVDGEGWTRTQDDDPVPIGVGQAAVWRAGEHHESGTETGMTAVIIQAESLTIDTE